MTIYHPPCRFCGAIYVGGSTFACGTMSCAGANDRSVECHAREERRKRRKGKAK
jgi:hypothetical protein